MSIVSFFTGKDPNPDDLTRSIELIENSRLGLLTDLQRSLNNLRTEANTVSIISQILRDTGSIKRIIDDRNELQEVPHQLRQAYRMKLEVIEKILLKHKNGNNERIADSVAAALYHFAKLHDFEKIILETDTKFSNEARTRIVELRAGMAPFRNFANGVRGRPAVDKKAVIKMIELLAVHLRVIGQHMEMPPRFKPMYEHELNHIREILELDRMDNLSGKDVADLYQDCIVFSERLLKADNAIISIETECVLDEQRFLGTGTNG